MKEYVIDANGMDEKELNRTIKEQAKYHDKLIIDNPDSKQNICDIQAIVIIRSKSLTINQN